MTKEQIFKMQEKLTVRGVLPASNQHGQEAGPKHLDTARRLDLNSILQGAHREMHPDEEITVDPEHISYVDNVPLIPVRAYGQKPNIENYDNAEAESS